MAEPVEVERKFFVAAIPGDLGHTDGVPTIQGYLALDGVAEVRIRRKGDRCTLTVKRGRGLSRAEHEIALETAQFEELWPATAGRRVKKTRIEVPLGPLTAELDFYHGALEGLSTVEDEFTSMGGANAFVPPSWFGREITDDPRYANRRLAVDGFPPPD